MSMALFSLNLMEKLLGDAQGEVVHTSVERLKDSVARDVERLLNSRCGLQPEALDGLPQCQQSVLSYGLQDFVAFSLSSEHDRNSLCQDIQRSLALHEPRLRQVQVVVSRTDGSTQRLHFGIRALLVAHEAMEPVSFDAVLSPLTQRYQVQRPLGG